MNQAIDSTNLPPKGTVVHWWHWNGKITTTYVGEYQSQSSRGPYSNVKRRDTGKTVRVRTPFLKIGEP